ncbi:MAG: hypothetical protein ACI9BN_001461 [Francisella sp.]|jgi:hypothetical protein
MNFFYRIMIFACLYPIASQADVISMNTNYTIVNGTLHKECTTSYSGLAGCNFSDDQAAAADQAAADQAAADQAAADQAAADQAAADQAANSCSWWQFWC